MTPRSVGTPSRPLDRETLVRVAADLADRDGWSRLTLSRVAQAVDRHVTSMYGHVDGLAALQRAIGVLALDELAEEVWRAAIGRVGAGALRAIAGVYRDYAKAHPGRVAAIGALPRDDPETVAHGSRLAEPVRATLRSFGLDDERVAVAHQVFSAIVDGFARAELAGQYADGGADEAFAQAIDLIVVALESGRWPV